MRTLATILGVGWLLVSPSGAVTAMRASFVLQAAATQTDSPPNPTPQTPPSEQKTEPVPDQVSPPPPPAGDQPPKAKTTSRIVTKKHHPRRQPVAPPATNGPTKVIVNNGGASDSSAQLSPGVSAQQASVQRQNTNLLLSTTESNLKVAAGRQLNASQQDTVTQVREYIKQAKASADAGDLQRAHNLAFKAKLLSDELAKH
jgi:hypothetical protein